MTAYRFSVVDEMNPWFLGVTVDADDEAQARRRAEHILFARRDVGVGVTLQLDQEGDDA